MDHKVCKQCQELKSVSDFYGRENNCKQCKEEMRKNRHLKDPGARKEQSRRWRESHREEDRARTERWRQKNKSLVSIRVSERSRKIRRKDGPNTDEILALRKLRCSYCGGPGGQVDHIVPISQGGPHDIINLASCCQKCNDSKGARTPEEWTHRWYMTRTNQ